jgi:hypothetical protein
VLIPPSTSVLRITLEVPESKPGVPCSSVLLEMLEGGNTKLPAESASKLRATNCTPEGAPSSSQRKIVLTRTKPQAGIWDLHLLGIYNVAESAYHLRVDYAVGESTVTTIAGDESALNGAFAWKLNENSFPVSPDAGKSGFILNGLSHREPSQVKKDQQVVVGGPLGLLRKYDASVKGVRIETGGSPGNDIDLEVLECPSSVGDATKLSDCETVGESGSPTDVETATFVPKPGFSYAVRINGYAIRDEGKFFCDETLVTAPENGSLAIGGEAPEFKATYGFSPDQIAKSALLNSPLFLSKDYVVRGAVSLETDDGVTLVSIPVTIAHP